MILMVNVTSNQLKHTFTRRDFSNISVNFDVHNITNRNCRFIFVYYYFNIESQRDAKRSGDANYHP